MYEDDPQEKVIYVFGQAVFRIADPLGRAIIGRSAPIAGTPRVGSPPSTPTATARQLVIAAAAAIDHDASSRCPPSACLGRRAPSPAPRSPSVAAPTLAGAARFERKDTEQFHVCLGAPGSRDTTTPVRAAGARHDLRRYVVLAAVPGDQRGARPRLLGRTRLPARTRTPARSASTSALAPTISQEAMSASATELARLRPSRRPTRSCAGPRRTSRAGCSSRWSRPGPG